MTVRPRLLASLVALASAIGCGSETESDGSGGAGSGGTSPDATADAAHDAALDNAAPEGGVDASDGSADAGSGPALVAATVNLRCLLDDWDQRKGPLAEGIAAVDPDLLALQEVCHSSSKSNLQELLALVSAITGKGYQSVVYDTHHNPLALANEGIAVVTPHAITLQQNVDLPDGFFNRGAIVTRVQTPVGSLLFTGTHLDFGSAATRQQELAVARAAIDAEREPGEPAILAGDMNESPSGACIQDALAAGWVDSWDALHPGDPGLTSPADDPKNRIDYLLLSDPDTKLVLTHALVFLDQAVSGVWPSDHRGVWAGLSQQP